LAQLAQAYIHLKPYSASDKKLKSLGRFAQQRAMKVAAEIYGGGVTVEVELEEGSVITRITVIGSIFIGVYSGVADYKGFKESVAEMCNDAREFAVDVCGPFVNKAHVPKEDVYRFERRLKTPGKLYRLSRRLERLQDSVDELSPSAVRKELASVRADLDAATVDLSAEERGAIDKGLRPRNLPPPHKWPQREPEKLAIRPDEDLEQSLLFDHEDSARDSTPHRRLVFKEKAIVPPDKRRRRGRRKMRDTQDFLHLRD
jgi:hypothetical protein